MIWLVVLTVVAVFGRRMLEVTVAAWVWQMYMHQAGSPSGWVKLP